LYSALQGPRLRLTSSQYREALRLRLLLPVIENGPNQYLCTCGYAREHQNDGHIHATVCRTANSQRTICHDKAAETLYDFLTKVQPDGHWTLETKVGQGARADIVGTIDHQVYWIDVAITAPCTNHALAQRSDVYPLTAARIREKQKLEHYESARQATRTSPVTVVPFVLESTGALGKHAAEFIDSACSLPRLLPIANDTLAKYRRNFKKLLNVWVTRGLAEGIQAARKAAIIKSYTPSNPPDVSDIVWTISQPTELDASDDEVSVV